MKVLISSLGSIGRRYVEILTNDFSAEVFYVPRQPNMNSQFIEQHNINVCDTIEEACSHLLDFGIISSPTSLHVECALAYARLNLPFIIEKPVSNSMNHLDILLEEINRRKLPVLVGFQLRHHPGYIHLMDGINNGDIGEICSFNTYVGQYLPNWRPNSEYSQESSALKALGGGVLWDLSHAFDIALSIMGDVESFENMMNSQSHLNIETEDLFNCLLLHNNNRFSNIHINYLDHQFTWNTRVIGTKGTLVWDYVNGTTDLFQIDGTTKKYVVPSSFSRNDLFISQINHWQSVLNNTASPLVSLFEGIQLTQMLISLKKDAKNLKKEFV